MKITSIKNMTFLLAFTACPAQASEPLNQKTWFSQAMDSVGQSSFMHAFSKYTQGDPELNFPGMPLLTAGPASEQYQTLAREAQQAAGITVQQHVPIIKMSKDYPGFKDKAASANSGAIYVNEENLAKMPYGAKRSVFMHEATHLKYHDNLTNTILSLATFCGATVITHTALKALKIAAWRKKASFAIGIAAACKSFKKYSQFAERRADIQGHYATQCSSCVNDAMQSSKNFYIDYIKIKQPNITEAEMPNSIHDFDQQRASSRGYVTQAELQQIVQDLGDKKCSYHLEQQK